MWQEIARTDTLSLACLKILPYLFAVDTSMREWVRAYYQHPVVCYTLKFAVAVHRDLMDGSLFESQKPEILKDKCRAIGHLNDLLQGSGSRTLLEIALLVMCVLANNEINRDSTSDALTSEPLAFDPPFPPPDTIRVYGKLGRVDAHGKAAVMMTARLGGLRALKLSGLAEKLA